MYYPSAYFRKKALAALKGRWQTALLVALIVNLPTLLIQAFSAFTGNDALPRLQAAVVSASRDGVLTQQVLLDEVNAIMNSTAFWTVRGLELLAWLITPCLTLGMYRWLICRLRGQDEPVSSVFSRMRLFLKAIGLQLLIILKVLLWMLPGMAVSFALLYTALRAGGDTQAQLAALQRAYSMMFPATLLIAVPGVIAALRYALSEYIMAERPENGILFCVRRSKVLMKDRKRNLFLLLVSFLPWYLLEMLVSAFLTGVLSLVVQMFAGLALTVYLSCSVAAFWLFLEKGGVPEETPAAEPDPERMN